MAGLPGNLLLQLAGFCHIPKNQHRAHRHATGFANGRGGVLNGIALTRAVQQHLLAGKHGAIRGNGLYQLVLRHPGGV